MDVTASYTILTFPALTSSETATAPRSDFPSQVLNENLGAFRGLAYAIAFQSAAGMMALIGWELWHLLR
jgi:hypothetical protein